MVQLVEAEGELHEFPDEATPDDISRALTARYAPQEPAQPAAQAQPLPGPIGPSMTPDEVIAGIQALDEPPQPAVTPFPTQMTEQDAIAGIQGLGAPPPVPTAPRRGFDHPQPARFANATNRGAPTMSERVSNSLRDLGIDMAAYGRPAVTVRPDSVLGAAPKAAPEMLKSVAADLRVMAKELSLAGLDPVATSFSLLFPELAARNEEQLNTLRQQANEQADKLDEMTPKDMTDFAQGVWSGFRSAVELAPSMIAAVALRNPIPAMAGIGGTVMGNSYMEKRRAGGTIQESLDYGVRQTGIELITEYAPTGILVSLFSRRVIKGDLMKTVAKFLGAEVTGEQAATFFQDVQSELAGLDSEMAAARAAGPEALWELRKKRAWITLIATIVGMGGQAVTAGVTRKGADIAGDVAEPVRDKVTRFREKHFPSRQRRKGLDTLAAAALHPDRAPIRVLGPQDAHVEPNIDERGATFETPMQAPDLAEVAELTYGEFDSNVPGQETPTPQQQTLSALNENEKDTLGRLINEMIPGGGFNRGGLVIKTQRQGPDEVVDRIARVSSNSDGNKMLRRVTNVKYEHLQKIFEAAINGEHATNIGVSPARQDQIVQLALYGDHLALDPDGHFSSLSAEELDMLDELETRLEARGMKNTPYNRHIIEQELLAEGYLATPEEQELEELRRTDPEAYEERAAIQQENEAAQDTEQDDDIPGFDDVSQPEPAAQQESDESRTDVELELISLDERRGVVEQELQEAAAQQDNDLIEALTQDRDELRREYGNAQLRFEKIIGPDAAHEWMADMDLPIESRTLDDVFDDPTHPDYEHPAVEEMLDQVMPDEQIFPKPKTKTRAEKQVTETLTNEKAKERVNEWKQAAKDAGRTQDNSGKVIFSLFDTTGVWSQPWVDAGYTVIRYDKKDGKDLMKDFPLTDISNARYYGMEIYGVLAAPPCTSFAVSGARWWADQHDKPSKTMTAMKYGLWASWHFETPLDYAIALLNTTHNFVRFANPSAFHVLENPVGRIPNVTTLPQWAMSFHPNNYGDPYTKKTLLWGSFNTDLPQANTVATLGSLVHKLRGDVKEDKARRSQTPEGFAYAFFMANHKPGPAKTAEAPKGDLLGDDVEAANALAAAERAKDQARSPAEDVPLETGDPGDLFSAARNQTDLVDQTAVPSGPAFTATYENQDGDKFTLRAESIEQIKDAVKQARAQTPGMNHNGIKTIPVSEYGIFIGALDGLNTWYPRTPQVGKNAWQDVLKRLRKQAKERRTVRFAMTVPPSPEVQQQEVAFNMANQAFIDNELAESKAQIKYFGEIQYGPGGFKPGPNYVPMLRGTAIGWRKRQLVRTGSPYEIQVMAPTKPLTRPEVQRAVEKMFKVNIYTGNVQKRNAGGFYRPGVGEIRIKQANDIEVIAHEFAHWLDEAYPGFKAAYQSSPELVTEMLQISYDETLDFEGFAEFVRAFMTQDVQAIAKAPRFYTKFLAVAKENGLEKRLFKMQELMHQYYYQGAYARFQGKFGDTRGGFADWFDNINGALFDQEIQKQLDAFHSIAVIERELKNDSGALKSRRLARGLQNTLYQNWRLLAGAGSIRHAIFQEGTVNWNDTFTNLERTGDSLRAIFERAGSDLQNALLYAMALRAKVYVMRGKASGFEQQEIETVINRHKDNPRVLRFVNDMQGFWGRQLDFYQKSGLLNQDQRAKMQHLNPIYMPMFRIFEKVSGEKYAPGNPFRTLKGSYRQVGDILDNITYSVSLLTERALLNQAKQDLYTFLRSDPRGGQYAVRVPSSRRPTRVPWNRVKQALRDLGYETDMIERDENGNQIIMDDDPDMETFFTFFTGGHKPGGELLGDQDIDTVMVNGEPVYYQVAKHSLLLDTLMHAGPRKTNAALQFLSGLKTAKTIGITLHPDFLLANLARDSFNAFAMSRAGQVPVLSALRGMYDYIRKTDVYWDAMRNGMGYSSTLHGETQELRRSTMHFFERRRLNLKKNVVLNTPAKMIGAWVTFAQAFEYGTRLSEFRLLKKKGFSGRQAAYGGREISTDFAMRGSSDIMPYLWSGKEFLNARIQGNYRLAREMRERTAPFVLRSLAAFTFPTMMLWMINHDKEWWKELPDWVKDLHWAFRIPGVDKTYLIPIPFETGSMFATLPMRIMEAIQKKDGERAAERLWWNLMNTMNLNPIPGWAWSYFREIPANVKFTGGPIVPRYLEDQIPWAQFDARTTSLGRGLGEAMNVSPMKLEHQVRAIAGGLGMTLMQFSSALLEGAGVMEHPYGERPDMRIGDWPGIGRFIQDQPIRGTQHESDVRQLLSDATSMARTISRFEDQELDAVAEKLSSTPEAQVLLDILDIAENAVEGLNEQAKEQGRIQMALSLSGEEKLAQIMLAQTDRNLIAREAMQELSTKELRELRNHFEKRMKERRQ